ncbi:alpha/beta hydrolase domain-containing protein [Leptospira ryugenii]|uniref:Alpha/beta hydrolase domain-containing protein n=1 Tax=Leptospira ryugenii TaxID=1917863 RepID=A0A2P2E0A5_9LEPT|nr:alpha/beta hydrolase domain-containing protein [Leptospira ryugenii]
MAVGFDLEGAGAAGAGFALPTGAFGEAFGFSSFLAAVLVGLEGFSLEGAFFFADGTDFFDAFFATIGVI